MQHPAGSTPGPHHPSSSLCQAETPRQSCTEPPAPHPHPARPAAPTRHRFSQWFIRRKDTLSACTCPGRSRGMWTGPTCPPAAFGRGPGGRAQLPNALPPTPCPCPGGAPVPPRPGDRGGRARKKSHPCWAARGHGSARGDGHGSALIGSHRCSLPSASPGQARGAQRPPAPPCQSEPRPWSLLASGRSHELGQAGHFDVDVSDVDVARDLWQVDVLHGRHGAGWSGREASLLARGER